MLRPLAFCLLALFAVPAAAQLDPGVVDATAGWWFLADSASGAGCNLHLLADEAIGGHGVEAPAGCVIAGKPAEDIAAWNLSEGQIVFLDAVRHVIFRLDGQEDGSWTGDNSDESFVLARSDKDMVALPTATGAAGAWTLARPGGPALCRVTLANQPQASGEGNLSLSLAKDCDPAIAGLKLDGWMIEGADLVLHGDGSRTLSFRADGKGGFAKAIKEGGKPLVMTKGP
jgi:hypothetical protein